MRFLIHVIDNISSHKIEDSKYQIQESEVCVNETDEICNILTCDSFYAVEGETEADSLIAISKIIKIKDEYGTLIPFTQLFVRSKNQLQTTDFNEIPHSEIRNNYYSTSCQPFYKRYVLYGHLERHKGDEKWVEYHEVEFFICPENKIVEISKEIL